MPEIDPNVYQILTLVLLLVIAVALIAIASALAGVKKSFDERTLPGDSRAQPAAEEPAPAGAAEPAPALGGTVTGTARGAAPSDTEAPAAAAQPTEAAVQPAASEAAAVTPAASGPAAGTPAPSEEAAVHGGFVPAEADREPTPIGEQPVEEPVAAEPVEDPQEQPFERDGRWWFRRGDELLVYDEQTGEWVAGPEEAAPAPAPAPAIEGAAAEGEGGYWKCPSCGAVNGSTAGTCRMCFTARP